MRSLLATVCLAVATSSNVLGSFTEQPGRPVLNVQVGDRPYFLLDGMDDGSLKSKLQSCSEGPFQTSKFVFAHRGAPLQYPEHTAESIRAAARQGAGTIECDVTFTKDRQLVCRHSQCDLHATTDILERPTLAAKCLQPFKPANGSSSASATCCTSDITLAEFKTLCGKMDGFDPRAETVAQYIKGTPYFRTDLYASCGTLVSHFDAIKLIDSYGLKFTPEIKAPNAKMPFDGNYSQEAYIQQIVIDYKTARIDPNRVYFQSYSSEDIFYLINNEPEFGKQAVYLDVSSPTGYANLTSSMADLAGRGMKIIGAPIYSLLKLDATNSTMIPSDYALAIKKAGMSIIAWSFDRTGWLSMDSGGWFYQSVAPLIRKDGDMYNVLHVLAQQVGIKAMFSDWPATVTYYANCFGL